MVKKTILKTKSKKSRKKPTKSKKSCKKRSTKSNEETFIYILRSRTNAKKSYVGVTNSLPRRLRQHNGEVVGGARYTQANRPWAFFAVFVVGNRHDALSIEWKIKHRKLRSDGVGIDGKVAAACRFGTVVKNFTQIIATSHA